MPEGEASAPRQVRGIAQRAAIQDAQVRGELALHRAFYGAVTLAFGSWQALDGALFMAGGPQRLTSPIFDVPARLIPGWPYTWGSLILAGGLLMLVGLAGGRWLLLGAAGAGIVSAWHVAYCLMIWQAVAWPSPGERLVAWSPLTDHGVVATLAALGAMRAARLWRTGRVPRASR